MNKGVKKIVILLLCLSCILQAGITVFYFLASVEEICFFPVRPPLTHPDPLEGLLIIKENEESKSKRDGYSAEEVLNGLLFLNSRDKSLLNREQKGEMLPNVRKIYTLAAAEKSLDKKIEEKKIKLELMGIKIAEFLNWDQLDFIVSTVDLAVLLDYEFPCWLELLSKIEEKAES